MGMFSYKSGAGVKSAWILGALLCLMPGLSGAAIHWEASWQLRANGQLLSVEAFSSRMSVDRVAQELARQNPAYQRYLVADGRMLLSGVKDHQHWLAEIQGHGEGVQGYVSALYFDAAREHLPLLTAQAYEFDSGAWVGLMPSQVGWNIANGKSAAGFANVHTDELSLFASTSAGGPVVAVSMSGQ